MWSFGSSWYLWPCYYYMQKRRKICSRKIPEQVSVSWPWASHLTSLISSLGSERVDFSDNEGPFWLQTPWLEFWLGWHRATWNGPLSLLPELNSFVSPWKHLFLTFLHENNVFLSTLLSDRNVILLHNWFTWYMLISASGLFPSRWESWEAGTVPYSSLRPLST